MMQLRTVKIRSGVAALVATSLMVAGTAPVGLAADADDATVTDASMAPPLGQSVRPDFDGDGYADLAIGSPYTRSGARNSGMVQVIHGGPDGLRGRERQVWTQGSEGIGDRPERGDQFGWDVASGDFDGDGYSDLVIGARWESRGAHHSGAVHVLYGSTQGLTADRSQRWTQDSPGIRDKSEQADQFGTSVIAADLNGDGFDDLVVGVPFEDRGSEDSGIVHVLYGTSSGLTAAGSQIWSQDSPGIGDRAEALDNFGQVLAAGDMNGDGIDDLAVGVPYESRGADRVGIVHVIRGTPRGLRARRDQIWGQDSPGIAERAEKRDQFGQSLSSGDFDGDGFSDLAVGVWFEDFRNELSNEGGFHVIYGSRKGLRVRGNQFWHQDRPGTRDRSHISDRFGQTFAAADYDGDGFDDLAVGSPSTDLSSAVHSNRGAVHVFRGGRRGINAKGDRYIHQDVPGVPGRSRPVDHFAASMASADYDGDGYQDLVIGIPWKDVAARDAGALLVMPGSARGVVAKAGHVIGPRLLETSGRRRTDGRFGWSLAGHEAASGTARTADPDV